MSSLSRPLSGIILDIIHATRVLVANRCWNMCSICILSDCNRLIFEVRFRIIPLFNVNVFLICVK